MKYGIVTSARWAGPPGHGSCRASVLAAMATGTGDMIHSDYLILPLHAQRRRVYLQFSWSISSILCYEILLRI